MARFRILVYYAIATISIHGTRATITKRFTPAQRAAFEHGESCYLG